MQWLKYDIKDYIDQEFVEEVELSEKLNNTPISSLVREGLACKLNKSIQYVHHNILDNAVNILLKKEEKDDLLSTSVSLDTISLMMIDDSGEWEVVCGGIITLVSNIHQKATLFCSKSRFRDLHLKHPLYLRFTSSLKDRDKSLLVYSKYDSLKTHPGLVKSILDFLQLETSKSQSSCLIPSPEEIRSIEYESKCSKLNQFQKEAITRSVCCQSFHLIHGPPGTGKTTTLVSLINVLVNLGKRVLISCSSNSSIDNILQQLTTLYTFPKLQTVRLGNPIRTAQQLIHYCLEFPFKRQLQKSDKQKKLSTMKVVIGTHTACYDDYMIELCEKNPFDYCIVDEATQSQICQILMPLSLASKGVLAGDHQQLPPLLKNCHLPSLKESIFEKIISHNARYLLYSDLSSLLAQQYRMNKLICLPSSIYFYSSRLHPGTANDSWTAADIAIDPTKSSVINLSCPLIWIDHNDQENRREMGSISNLIEINIIVRLVVDLVRDCGVDPSKITIITSFNKQKYLLSTAKKGLERFGEFKDISISTIDGYQGQENDIVIFSAVRSNQEGEIGFLKDERRINVSITRAKRMFIMVGCSKSLTKKPHGFLSIIYHVTERYGDVIHFEQKKPGEEAIFTFMNRTKKKKVPTEWKELMKNFVKDRIAKNFLVEVTSKKSKSISISADKTVRSIARQKRFNSIRAYYPLNRSKLKSQTQASPIENENQLENSLSKKPSSSFDWSLWLPRDEQQECKIIQNPAMIVRQFQRIKIQKQKASSNHPNKENQKRAQSEDVYKMD